MGVNGAAAGERPQHAMRGAVQMVRTTLAGQIAQELHAGALAGRPPRAWHARTSQLRGREPVDLEA